MTEDLEEFDAMNIDVAIGRRLRCALTDQGLKIEDAALELGIEPAALTEHCLGSTRIGPTLLLKMAQLLSLPVSYFLVGDDRK